MNISRHQSSSSPSLAMDSISHQVMDCFSEGVIIVDSEYCIQHANLRMEAIIGTRIAQVVGQPLFLACSILGEASLLSALERAFQGKTTSLAVVGIRHAGSDQIQRCSVNTFPIEDAQKKRIGVAIVCNKLSSAQDISDPSVTQKQTNIIHKTPEEQLQSMPIPDPDKLEPLRAELTEVQLLDLYRELIDAAEEVILLLDDQGNVVYINRAGAERVSRTQKEIIGHNIARFLPPDAAKVRFNWGTKALASSKPVLFEDSREGRFIEHHMCPMSLHLSDRQFLAIFSRDITARKRAEEKQAKLLIELQAREEQLKLLIDNLHDTISCHTPDGRVTYVSPSIRELLGYEPSEIIGRSPGDYIPKSDLQKAWNTINQAISLHSDGYTATHRMRHNNGKYVWIESIGRLIYNSDDTIKEIHCCLRDVTARLEAERLLQKSHEQMRALAAHVERIREEERAQISRDLHDDLGQILTGIKMDVAWMGNRMRDDQKELRDRASEMVKMIETGIQTVRRISTELRPGHLDDLGLSAAIDWQANEFQRRYGIKCSLDYDEDYADLDVKKTTALFRIFQEALTNIVRHAHATEVNVRLRRRSNHVLLYVHDNGKGISKSEINHPSSLGLLGMKERALAHGGTVTISGKAANGTVVQARIPYTVARSRKKGR